MSGVCVPGASRSLRYAQRRRKFWHVKSSSCARGDYSNNYNALAPWLSRRPLRRSTSSSAQPNSSSCGLCAQSCMSCVRPHAHTIAFSRFSNRRNHFDPKCAKSRKSAYRSAANALTPHAHWRPVSSNKCYTNQGACPSSCGCREHIRISAVSPFSPSNERSRANSVWNARVSKSTL